MTASIQDTLSAVRARTVQQCPLAATVEPPRKLGRNGRCPRKECEATALAIRCSHGRSAAQVCAKWVLQVVPVRDHYEETRVSWHWEFGKFSDVTPEAKLSHTGKLRPSLFLKLRWGSEDSIAVGVTTGHPQGRQEVAFGPSGWKRKSLQAPAANPGRLATSDDIANVLRAAAEMRPDRVVPRSFPVKGRGCAGPDVEGEIVCFPSTKIRVELTAELLSEISRNSLIPKFMNWIERVFGAADRLLGTKTIKFKFDVLWPSGSAMYEEGWEEDPDWRACYYRTFRAGVDPLFGFKVDLGVNLVVVGGAALGIPPWISRFASHVLGEIFAGFLIELKCRLMGRWDSRQHYGEAQEQWTGHGVEFGAVGQLGVGLTWERKGSVFKAKFVGQGLTRVRMGTKRMRDPSTPLAFKGTWDPFIVQVDLEISPGLRKRGEWAFGQDQSWAF